MVESAPDPAWRLRGAHGAAVDGYAVPRLLARYLHLHPADNPGPYLRFVESSRPGA